MWIGGDGCIIDKNVLINNKQSMIMRSTGKFFMPMLMTLVLCWVSCTNDYEMWNDTNETETWEFELGNIVCDLDFLFENSKVKFLQAEEVNCKVDSTDFFNNESYYPVCMKNLYNVFMLGKLNFVKNDTNTIHMPYNTMRVMVSNIVNNQDKYDIVRLTWLFDGDTFSTIAAFDKTNGQIVYDNILTNIPLFQVEIPSKKSKLTRSENGSGELVTRIFYKDVMSVTQSSIHFELMIKCLCNVWYNNGTYTSSPVYDSFAYKFSYPNFSNDPNHPESALYPQANAAYKNGQIAYYVWVGKGTSYFPHSSNDVFDVCYAVYMDASTNPKHNYSNVQYDANCIDINQTMNMMLFEPNPSDGEWGFE